MSLYGFLALCIQACLMLNVFSQSEAAITPYGLNTFAPCGYNNIAPVGTYGYGYDIAAPFGEIGCGYGLGALNGWNGYGYGYGYNTPFLY